MSRSVNEIEVLARKAASGAGFPPAQADSFGRAAAWHLALDGDSGALTEALADRNDSPVLRLHLLPEDIRRALDLSGPDVVLSLQTGDEALAPAYARLAGVTILTCEVLEQGSIPRLHLSTTDGANRSLPGRLTLDMETYRTLADLAARTLVPASDASRAGAGAGDIDND